jgi:hypothetical protein
LCPSLQFGNYIGPELADDSDDEQMQQQDGEEGDEEAEWDQAHGLDAQADTADGALEPEPVDDTRMITAAGQTERKEGMRQRLHALVAAIGD